MRFARRHARALVVLFALPLSGAECIPGTDEPDGERQECEDVCAAEAVCLLGRSQQQCVEDLCNEDGFKTILDGDNTVDFQTHAANDCMKDAEDCLELVQCSCLDSCSREEDCGLSPLESCVNDCETLFETLAEPGSQYLENRCEMESTCADLPACASSG